jgi:hypothetical protein
MQGYPSEKGISSQRRGENLLPITENRQNAEVRVDRIEKHELWGTISFQIDHYARAIIINLLDKDSALGTAVPDAWKYKDIVSKGKIRFYRAKIVRFK